MRPVGTVVILLGNDLDDRGQLRSDASGELPTNQAVDLGAPAASMAGAIGLKDAGSEVSLVLARMGLSHCTKGTE